MIWGLIVPAAIGSFVAWVLFYIGVAVVTYTGVSELIDWGLAYVKGTIFDLPPVVKGMLGILRLDQCINVVASAWAVNGALRLTPRLVFRR